MACLTNYTVQCRDVDSGKTGCFLFDVEHWRHTGEFRAVSPVFPDLTRFYAWDNANGSARKGCYIERALPPETPNDREALRLQIEADARLQAWRERGVL